MIATFDLCESDSIDVPNATLAFAEGTFELRTSRGTRSLALPSFLRDNYIEIFCTGEWGALMSPRAAEIVVFDIDRLSVDIVGRLARLDMLVCDDGYDPGGMDRIVFHQRGRSEAIVETEVGIARVSRRSGIVWQRLHDDATCRVTKIDNDTVHLECDRNRIAYRYQDGRDLFL